MENKKWARLDNASHIFLAARNNVDTKVFRLSAEMTDIVDPVMLQTALNYTYYEYPLFHSTLRRGIFWYYLEEMETITPRVQLDTQPPCSSIYHYDKREFLFRVLYKEKRIHLEVFHALTDGTGALWFFEDLLVKYTKLRYKQKPRELSLKAEREKQDLEDSFNRYFRKKKNVDDEKTETKSKEKLEDKKEGKKRKVYRIKGQQTPDDRPRVITLNLPLKKSLALARETGVSLTIYMTALYLLSIYQDKENKAEDTTLTVSIPVNLRQFFPSVSARNFFSTTILSYTFKKEEEPDFRDICRKLDEEFKKHLEKEELEKRLRRYLKLQNHPITRIVIRPLKDGLIKVVNKLNNRGITTAMSNLGIARFPEETAAFIENVYFYTSVIRPQFCMISYGEYLNLSFTSPFTETGAHRNFVRFLSEKGMEVTIDANKVTREELGEE